MARRRLVAILAGAVVAGVGGCGGNRELDETAVRTVLLRPGTIPPLPPVGYFPVSEELDDRCPYLRPGRGHFADVRPEACRHLRFFRTPIGIEHVELSEPVSRVPLKLSPIEAPSPDVRVVRFTYRWDTTEIGETVRTCFRWGEGASVARFARVGGKWQLHGFEDLVYQREEEPCPAEGQP